LDFQSGEPIALSAEEFISREKYNGQYNIMWRFVTGILAFEDQKDLVRLFEQIEMKPRDLLGPVHMRFLMHCFSEVDGEDNPTSKKFRGDMDTQLSQLPFAEIHYIETLGNEMEFPEHIFSRYHEKCDPKQQEGILRAASARPHMSDELSNQIWSLYQSNPPKMVREIGAKIIGKYPNHSSKAVISVISDPDKDFSSSVMKGLMNVPNLSGEILSAAMDAFSESRMPNYLFALQNDLPQSVIDRLMLHYQQNVHRDWVIEALAKSSLTRQSVFSHLIESIDDPDFNVRFASVKALEEHTHLAASICHKIASLLNDMSDNWEGLIGNTSLLQLLRYQANLPKSIEEQIWRMLENENETVRDLAFVVLRRQFPLWAEGNVKRLAQSHHRDNLATAITSGAFRHKLAPPDDIFSHYFGILTRSTSGSLSSSIQRAALNTLSECPSLPVHIVNAIWQLVDQLDFEGSPDVECAFWSLWQKQEVIPDDILSDLCSRFLGKHHDNDDYIIKAFLSGNRPLPDSIVDYMVPLCLRKDPEPVYGVFDALYKQQRLLPHVLETIASLLVQGETLSFDPWISFSNHIERILRKHANFGTLLPRLGSKHWVSLFRILLDKAQVDDIVCSVQGHYIHVSTPDRS
jgi:hypothetical protein